jgi:hypothetical protein
MASVAKGGESNAAMHTPSVARALIPNGRYRHEVAAHKNATPRGK